jgi:AcrR family transcriptional regulator
MPRRTLTPAIIVDAAVALGRGREHTKLTGKALGDALGVDRSAIWRHFADQDALLRAVGDRLLTMALARVDAAGTARDRLKELARAVVAVFVEHPMIGAVTAGRTTQGPGELTLVEFTLQALSEAGVADAELARVQRTFADTLLGYAGLRANQELLPEAVRRHDREAWSRTYATAPAEEYPMIADHVTALAGVSDETVLEAILISLSDAVDRIIAR